MKAVLLGALVNTACVFGYSFAGGLTVALLLNVRRVPTAKLEDYSHSLGFLIPSLIAGTACALLGGFVAARIARRREIVCAAVSALPNMVITAAFVWNETSAARIPTWYLVAAYAAVIPAAILGGRLGVRRKRTLAAVMAA